MEVATDEASTPIKQDTKKGKLRYYPYNIKTTRSQMGSLLTDSVLETNQLRASPKRNSILKNDSLYFLFVDYEPKIVEIGYPHNMAADSLISSKEKILDLLNESTTSREKCHEMIELRLQNEAKKLAFKEVKEENKILLKNLASIDDDYALKIIHETNESWAKLVKRSVAAGGLSLF
ncbi:unnamed protein product [Brassica rapa subsp. narinosa]